MGDQVSARSARAIGELMRAPWVIDLIADVQRRRPKSHQLVESLRAIDVSNSIFWPFHAPPFPLAIIGAQGSQVTDADGNTYLDMAMGFGALALHGHNPEFVVEFVRDRLSRNTGNACFNPIELDLAALLKELLPHCEKFAFFNSGSEATHGAIRLARAYTGRKMVGKLEGALHGTHDISAYNTAFWYHGHPLMPFPAMDDHGIAPTAAFTGAVTAPQNLLILRHSDPQALDLLERYHDKLGCVIAEAATMSLPFADQTVPFVRALAHRCAELNVPFILDEVLTGFRCGISGAAAYWDIPADLYTYGKVMTGLGLPLAAIGGRADILQCAQTSGSAVNDYGVKTLLGTTHAGNYLSLCAAFAALCLLRQQGDTYYLETRAKVRQLKKKLSALRNQLDVPLRLVGFGDFTGMLVFLPDGDYHDQREFALALNPMGTTLLTLLLRQRGVYVADVPTVFTGGCHSRSDLDGFFEAVADSVLEMKKNGFPFCLA